MPNTSCSRRHVSVSMLSVVDGGQQVVIVHGCETIFGGEISGGRLRVSAKPALDRAMRMITYWMPSRLIAGVFAGYTKGTNLHAKAHRCTHRHGSLKFAVLY